MVVGENQKTVNGETSSMNAEVKEIEGKYYIPFSELEDVYNVKATYIEESNTVVLDSLDKKLEIANSLEKIKLNINLHIFQKQLMN